MNKILSNKMKNIRGNKGFTLVELIVVLVLLSILLGTTLYAGLGWQDWAQFKHEEACAEEIFYAAQNQLTELDSSNALYRKVARPMMNSDTEGDYIAGYVVNNIDQIVYDRDANGDVKYNSKTIWINSNKDKDPGKLVRLRANANEYDTYVNNPSACGEEAKLLFDIISPYISDKSVLNGAIILEFSPDAGQVFSVCYSDKASSLTYGAEGSGTISVMNRILQIREDKMLGYFSVDTLSKKIRGRGTIDTNLRLKIDNGEVYSLVVEDDDAELEADDLLEFTLYDGENSGIVDLMKFSVSNKDITTYTSFKEGLEAAQSNPVDVQVVYNENYKGNYDKIESFSVPIFRVGTLGTKNQVYVILDAADVQAQSLAFSQSVYFKGKDPYYNEETEEAFKNTYSFYRFGLSKDINYIYADVTVLKNGGNATSNVVNSYSDDPTAYHIQQSTTPRGECVAFASHELTDGNNVYEIENMRHFYNIRYESDYKIDESKKDTFKLIADISWADFIGGNKDGINYFLNSYVDDNTIKNGINYNGNVDCVSGDTTADYPFPGFRKLDKNDKFTQDVASGGQGESFTISDLNITIAGNIVYGVYGQDIKASCKLGDFSKTQGYEDNYSDQDSKGMKAARAGKMPLGLFAENQGVIENITLNRHKVIGVMNATQGSTSRLLYTCMVGGFAGNNLGHVSNLTLLDHTTNVATSDKKAGVTKVNGRTDVGGIIGRQSYIVKDAFDSTDVTLSGLKNYGTVSGLENIGGIVGRAYTRFVTDKDDVPERFTEIYKNAKYNGSTITSYREILRRYYAYHDGYEITDTYKSITGADVSRNNIITIEDCHNRGKVSGDSLFYPYIDDATQLRTKNLGSNAENAFGTETIKACSFIGGIAGTTMDGIIYDTDYLKVEGDKTVYEAICEPFLNGGTAFVKIKNCDSYIGYDINPNNITNASIYPSIKYDNYVGGLVGYSKMTAIENCNTKQDNYINKSDGVYQSYVLGNRFVGGLIGCDDLTRFDAQSSSPNPDGYNNRVYAATNYNNVIGRVFVGGVSGAMGIGARDINGSPNALFYRNPATSYMLYASRVTGEVVDSVNDNINDASRKKPVGARNLLNTGMVLCLKNLDTSNPFKEYGDGNLGNGINSQNRAGYCGGIVGLACHRFSEVDNIQSEETKSYAFKMINRNQSLDLNTINEQEMADTIVDKLDNSPFGGIHVGGIAGFIIKSNKVNYSYNTASYVDAAIIGQNFVGGIFGDTNYDNWPKAFNCYPAKKSQSSSGMVVIGDDCVGGLFGGLPHDMILTDESNITAPYTVIGRYAVGGYTGIHLFNGGNTHGRIDASLAIDGSSKVKVYGKCFVGGILGYSSSEQIGIPPTSKTISFDKVSVIGDYFVGGLAGGLADNSDKYNILDFVPSVNVGDNVSVQANAFGGGVAGLYYVIPRVDKTSYSEFINNGSTIYRIANEKCVYSGDDRNIQTFDNIVNADNRGDAIFNKDNSRVVSTDFGGYTNKVDVTSRIFAGGLFGYVPNCIGDQKINIKGFVNGGKIVASSYLKGSGSGAGAVAVAEASDKSANYSYLGGVIGRVPRGMMLINCTNTKNGKEYTSQGTYIGGLTEVNAGVISGDISKDTSGVITVNSYLINNTSYTYDKNVGAIAGVNGTLATGCDGVIQFCQNRGDIISTAGEASGIVASQARASVVTNSINLGAITGTSKAAGIVASPSGTDIVELCRNYGPLEGTTKNGIAGGTVGTLNKNLEASGLSEENGGKPIANMDNTSQVRNFYIYGDDSVTPVSSSNYFYNIDFETMNLINSTYFNQFDGDWYGQKTAVSQACNNPSTTDYTDYSWLRKKAYYGAYQADINSVYNYSRLVYSAFRKVNEGTLAEPSSDAEKTALRIAYMNFYKNVVESGEIPGMSTVYTDNPIVPYLGSYSYTPPYNESGNYKDIDYSFYLTKPDNGWNKYPSMYSWGGVGARDLINSILANNGTEENRAKYPLLFQVYEDPVTGFNKNANDFHEYMKKLYSAYMFSYGTYSNDNFDHFYAFFVDIVNTGQLPVVEYGEEISGDTNTGTDQSSYGTEDRWPKQLRMSLNGDTYSLVFFLGGTKYDTPINGLSNDPISFPDDIFNRMETYTGNDKNGTGTNIDVNSLDSKFVNMVNNEQARPNGYPNSYFVTE